MADQRDDSTPAPEPRQPQVGQPQPPAIDIEQLAERVYRLLLADLRLGLARGERLPARRGGGW